MKYIFSILFIGFSIAHAQTAQEIVTKHLQAIGGKAKIAAITSYSYEMGNSIVYYKSPAKWRIDDKEGGKIVQTHIYHGGKGWTIYESREAEPATFGMSFENFIPGLLAYATGTEYKVEALGADNESDNLMLKVTPLINSFHTYTFYINPATYMITKMRESSDGFSSMAYFKNYTTINGVKISLNITRVNEDTNKEYSESTKSNLKINIPLNDTLFLKPTLKKSLKPFEGSNNKWGYKDENLVTVIKPEFDKVWGFQEDNLAKVSINKLYGYIDIKGKIIAPIKYQEAENFNEGMAGVMLKGKWGFINKSGKEAEPLKYEKIKDFSGGLGAVKLNNKWGFVDKTMKLIIPIEYDDVGYFYEGLSMVMQNKKYGYADKTGKMVIPLEYDSASYFKDGKAKVLCL